MAHLLLVRHGNTFEDGDTPRYIGLHSDPDLTGKGRDQARTAGKALRAAGFHPARILCGRLKRQTETAGIIAAELGYNGALETDAALDELDYGVWEGLPPEEIARRWPDEFTAWNERSEWPAGIFGQDEQAFRRAHTQLLARVGAGKQAVLAVTSNAVLASLHDLISAQEGVRKRVKVRTGCICAVDLSGATPRLSFWNHDPAAPLPAASLG